MKIICVNERREALSQFFRTRAVLSVLHQVEKNGEHGRINEKIYRFATYRRSKVLCVDVLELTQNRYIRPGIPRPLRLPDQVYPEFTIIYTCVTIILFAIIRILIKIHMRVSRQ